MQSLCKTPFHAVSPDRTLTLHELPCVGVRFSFSGSSAQAAAAAAVHCLLMRLQRPCCQHVWGICQLCLSIGHLEAPCL